MVTIVLIGIIMNSVLFLLIYRLEKWSKKNTPYNRFDQAQSAALYDMVIQDETSVSEVKTQPLSSKKSSSNVRRETGHRDFIFSSEIAFRNTTRNYKNSNDSQHSVAVHNGGNEAQSFREKEDCVMFFKVCQN